MGVRKVTLTLSDACFNLSRLIFMVYMFPQPRIYSKRYDEGLLWWILKVCSILALMREVYPNLHPTFSRSGANRTTVTSRRHFHNSSVKKTRRKYTSEARINEIGHNRFELRSGVRSWWKNRKTIKVLKWGDIRSVGVSYCSFGGLNWHVLAPEKSVAIGEPCFRQLLIVNFLKNFVIALTSGGF